MKKMKGDWNPYHYSLVPIELSQVGRERFPKYVDRKAWWVKYTGRSNREATKNEMDGCIRVWFEGLKTTQWWDSNCWVQKIDTFSQNIRPT